MGLLLLERNCGKRKRGKWVLCFGFRVFYSLFFRIFVVELIELCTVFGMWCVGFDGESEEMRERGISGVDEEDDMCDSCEEGDDWVWRR